MGQAACSSKKWQTFPHWAKILQASEPASRSFHHRTQVLPDLPSSSVLLLLPNHARQRILRNQPPRGTFKDTYSAGLLLKRLVISQLGCPLRRRANPRLLCLREKNRIKTHPITPKLLTPCGAPPSFQKPVIPCGSRFSKPSVLTPRYQHKTQSGYDRARPHHVGRSVAIPLCGVDKRRQSLPPSVFHHYVQRFGMVR